MATWSSTDPAGVPLWSTHTDDAGDHVTMQSDGNLVVYLGARPLCSTGTGGKGPSYAVVRTDGNFVVYKNSGGATWAPRGGRIK
jgi:hypothetical protein